MINFWLESKISTSCQFLLSFALWF